jgi:hypothetical protein
MIGTTLAHLRFQGWSTQAREPDPRGLGRSVQAARLAYARPPRRGFRTAPEGLNPRQQQATTTPILASVLMLTLSPTRFRGCVGSHGCSSSRSALS